MSKTKKKTTRTIPNTTISIHGDGFDIDAEFAPPDGKGKGEVGQSIADLITMLAARVGPIPSPTVAPEPPRHDFDVVQAVIADGNPEILRAIIDLASAKLEQAGVASASG